MNSDTSIPQMTLHWQPIESAPKDGTRFIGRRKVMATYRNHFESKDRFQTRITWQGKASHIALYGWCYGRVENVNLWQPTHWKPMHGPLHDAEKASAGLPHGTPREQTKESSSASIERAVKKNLDIS